MSSGLQRTLNGIGKRKVESFVWTDDEVRLLLNVTLEYKAQKESMNLNWERVSNKYLEILDSFIRSYPSNPHGSLSEKFPHKIEDITKCVLSTKMKSIRGKYRASVESGKKKGNNRVIQLYRDLCLEIWGDCSYGSWNSDQNKDEDHSGPKIPFIDVEAIQDEDDEEEETEVLQMKPSSSFRTSEVSPVEDDTDSKREELKRKVSSESSIGDLLEQDIALKRKYLAKMEELDQSYNEGMNELSSTIKELNRSLLDSLGVIQESLQWQRFQMNNNHSSNKENSCKCGCKCGR